MKYYKSMEGMRGGINVDFKFNFDFSTTLTSFILRLII
jgi:hypothetical protein